ncbi:hypothetical protein [Streptomyces sp. JV180]|uniref:hypothetical protein n=1 Tax=Streptomyces sp. JV180 TaxID=858634 RepID=UPI00168ACEDE|nr:hypothetical protein [Streptomyces sp. JV180]MBD3544475.1 hypothetical protein [Streptomyces sp. JV180]
MPRTVITGARLTANAHTAQPAATTIDAALVTNGAAINGVDFEHTVLVVANTAGGSKSVTVRAGNSTASFTAKQGDLVAPVAGSGGQTVVGPFTSSRFQQHGGALHVDFESGFTGTITVLRIPRYT